MVIAPIEYRAQRLARETSAMDARHEGPAAFRRAGEGRRDIALSFEKAEFSDAPAALSLDDRPEAEAHQGPLTKGAKEFAPRLFLRQRRAADEARDGGISPHLGEG